MFQDQYACACLSSSTPPSYFFLHPTLARTQIRPAHYHGRVAGADGDDDDEDEDETATEWSLRKCAASSLDALAVRFGGAVLLPLVLPELDRRLADLSAEWPQRESGMAVRVCVCE